MTQPRPDAPAPHVSPAAGMARGLIRSALKASLATRDHISHHPYASLVTLATEPDGTPLLLISRLAVHTINLEADSRASLLIDGTDSAGDPMAGGRVTLIGRAAPTLSDTARSRFLARHPAAAAYAGFADFRFYAFAVEKAHVIGGFGRIADIPGADLIGTD